MAGEDSFRGKDNRTGTREGKKSAKFFYLVLLIKEHLPFLDPLQGNTTVIPTERPSVLRPGSSGPDSNSSRSSNSGDNNTQNNSSNSNIILPNGNAQTPTVATRTLLVPKSVPGAVCPGRTRKSSCSWQRVTSWQQQRLRLATGRSA